MTIAITRWYWAALRAAAIVLALTAFFSASAMAAADSGANPAGLAIERDHIGPLIAPSAHTVVKSAPNPNRIDPPAETGTDEACGIGAERSFSCVDAEARGAAGGAGHTVWRARRAGPAQAPPFRS